MDKTFVAQGVAHKLFAAEAALDSAMTQVSELLAGIQAARAELNISPVTAAPTVAKLTAAMSALGQANAAVAEAHGELNDVKLRIGIRTKMIGSMEKPPESAAHNVVTAQRRAG